MKVSIASLGGIGEIGMNVYVYETETTAFVVDCGVKFAGSSEPGIDLIIPDFSYLETIKDKLKCAVITHAHEDHGGALPYLLKEYPMPVAASRYTMNLLEYRLKEHGLNPEKAYLAAEEPLTVGDFTISFIPLSHSIHGTGALLAEAADGFSALHISDYKIDFFPVTSVPFPAARFAEIGRRGLNCLLADSTNCAVSGFTPGERTVRRELEKIFKESGGRIFFTTFASNAERLQTVFDLAEEYGRTVIIEGSSLLRSITEARRSGLLKIKDGSISKRGAMQKLPDEKICVVATGSQGEKASVISKIARSDYACINVREGDVFVFSSRAIPGNERNIINVINRISKAGGRCVTASDGGIHVSGHASGDDAAMLIKLTKPDYLVPVHGEYSHLQKHRLIAVKTCGMEESRVILSSEGEKLIFTDGELTGREEIPWGKRFVDMKGGFLLDKEQLKMRKRMASEGAVFVFAEPDIKKGKMNVTPSAASAGFEMDGARLAEFSAFLSEEAEKAVFERFSAEPWRELLIKLSKKYFKKKMGRRPIITVTIREKA